MPEHQYHYLGDGVYAKFDGYHIVLSANVPATDTIYLDFPTAAALREFIDKIFGKESQEK